MRLRECAYGDECTGAAPDRTVAVVCGRCCSLLLLLLLLCAVPVTHPLQSEAVSLAWVQFLKKLSPKGDTMEGTRGLRRDAHGALM